MASKRNTRKRSTGNQTRAKQTKPSNKKTTESQRFLKDEILILVTLAVCVLLMISNFGIGGYLGDAVSSFMFGVFGIMAYIVPILLFIGITFISSNNYFSNFSRINRISIAVYYIYIICGRKFSHRARFR